MYIRNLAPALAMYLAVFASCMVLAVVPACNSNQRQKTLHASLISVNAAADGFVAWDRKHMQGLADTATSREEAETTLAAYLSKRTSVVSGFEVVYRALAMAATQTDDLSLRAALDASKELIEAIQKLRGGT